MEMVLPASDVYETRNTALAAYLRIEGFVIDEVVPAVGLTGDPAVFKFRDDPAIAEKEHLWQLGQATGNLNDYWESYRLCLKMIRVGKL